MQYLLNYLLFIKLFVELEYFIHLQNKLRKIFIQMDEILLHCLKSIFI